MPLLLHLVQLGALIRIQSPIKFLERFGADRRHLRQQLAALAGEPLHIGIALARFGGGRERQAILLQLFTNRVSSLASLLEDGLGLRLLRIGQIQCPRHAAPVPVRELMTARLSVRRRSRGRSLREH
jgi:hypothetical protein